MTASASRLDAVQKTLLWFREHGVSGSCTPIPSEILMKILAVRCSDGCPPPELVEVSCHLLARLAANPKVDATEVRLQISTALCSTLHKLQELQQFEDCASRILKRCLLPIWDGRTIPTDELIKGSDNAAISVNDIDNFRLMLCHGVVQSGLVPSLKEDVIALALTFLEQICIYPSSLTRMAVRTVTKFLTVYKDPCVQNHSSLVKNKINDFAKLAAQVWAAPAHSPRDNAELLVAAIRAGDLNADKLLCEALKAHWGYRATLLTVAALLPLCTKDVVSESSAKIVEMLLSSLDSPTLASAGADAYRAYVGLLPGVELWWEQFSLYVLRILQNPDPENTGLRNLLVHWLPLSLRAFPGLFDKIYYPETHNLSLRGAVGMIRIALREGNMMLDDLWNEPTISIVGDALNNSNPTIRSDAISAVCYVGRPRKNPVSSAHLLLELERREAAVMSFLISNSCCDCGPLREAILAGVGTLLEGLQLACVDSVRKKRGDALIWKYTGKFLSDLHSFIILGLAPGEGNYQRRILCIRLLSAIFNVFASAFDEKSSEVLSRLKEEGNWKFSSLDVCNLLAYILCEDVSSDITEASAEILKSQFCPGTVNSQHHPCHLTCAALSCTRSVLFHRTQNAPVAFSVVASWLGVTGTICKNCLCSEYGNKHLTGEDTWQLISLLKQEAIFQWKNLLTGLITGAKSGNLVHSVLTSVATVSHLLNPEDALEMLLFIERAKDHMLQVLESESLGKMSSSPNTVDAVLCTSPDELYVESQHLAEDVQYAIHCVWLNLKAFCDLALKLSETEAISSSSDSSDCCVSVVVDILLRCSNAGVEETAAAALGQMVRVSTQLQRNGNCRRPHVEQAVRKQLLQCLDLLQNSKITATRRSPGLPLVINKVAVADCRPDKPLLQLAASRLTEIASQELPNYSLSGEKQLAVPDAFDLPQMRAILCLAALIRDAGLWIGMTPYIEPITFLCITRITDCSAWPIRNACQQLLTAISSKIAPASGSSLESLVRQYPSLGLRILDTLRGGWQSLPQQAALLPALMLLLQVSAHGTCPHSLGKMQVAEEFCHALFRVVTSSRVHAVRRVAAKAYTNLTPVEDIVCHVGQIVKQLEIQHKDRQTGGMYDTNNQLHGLLLVLQGLLGTPKWVENDCTGRIKNELVHIVGKLSEDKTVPWPCRQICEEIWQRVSPPEICKRATCITEETLNMLKTELQYRPQIGLHAWAKSRLTQPCSCTNLSEMRKSIYLMWKEQKDGTLGLNEIFGDAICSMGCRLVEFEYESVMNELIMQVASLLDAAEEEMRYALYKLIVLGLSAGRHPPYREHIIKHDYFNQYISTGILRDLQCTSSGMQAAAIHLLSCVLAASAKHSGPGSQRLQELLVVANVVSQIVTNPTSNEELRKGVADGLCLLVPVLPLFSISCTDAKYVLLHSQVKLLQDEDPDVRLAAANIFPNATAYTALQNILSSSFLTNTFGSALVAYTKVLDWLCCFDDNYFIPPSTTVRNPFLEAAADMFEEPSVVIRQLEQASNDFIICCEQSDLEAVRHKINIQEISENALSKLKENSVPEVQSIALAAIANKLEALASALWQMGCDSVELEPLLGLSQSARQLLLPTNV
ncbi:uncharacterized protein LOC126106344 [Schistocerca cancellata]|uniref:uncharacterized protein LOC126106344 n=1 Tax=Schistocerca cancellata TaxID=274614 RepID=UPI0021181784|nr:uncharacterized protein LOC126106344 [Schistocerca cancellata]